jgi:hypothetical protein
MNDTCIEPEIAPQKAAFGSAEAGRLGGLERARRLREAPLTHPQRRLLRVREQLDLLDRRIETLLKADAVDYQAVERAARSSASLSEQERNLDGRPLAGSMRPRPERRQAAPRLPGPVD